MSLLKMNDWKPGFDTHGSTAVWSEWTSEINSYHASIKFSCKCVRLLDNCAASYNQALFTE